MPCIDFGEVLHDVSTHSARGRASQTPRAKLAPGLTIQEIGPKVGSGRSFVSGPFFARQRYIKKLLKIDMK